MLTLTIFSLYILMGDFRDLPIPALVQRITITSPVKVMHRNERTVDFDACVVVYSRHAAMVMALFSIEHSNFPIFRPNLQRLIKLRK